MQQNDATLRLDSFYSNALLQTRLAWPYLFGRLFETWGVQRPINLKKFSGLLGHTVLILYQNCVVRYSSKRINCSSDNKINDWYVYMTNQIFIFTLIINNNVLKDNKLRIIILNSHICFIFASSFSTLASWSNTSLSYFYLS